MKKLILLLAASFMLSCATTKTIKFTEKPDDITTTNSLKEYLSNNPNPKIVLRTSETAHKITDNERSDYLYNAIENELLKSGFIVRDRQLFNQIVTNDQNNNNYGNLKDKSDTDLIIELIKLDPSIAYTTNKYYDSKGKERTESMIDRKKFGASIEFKIIMIDSNEFAGIYKFNYTPCTEGCIVSGLKRFTRKELDEIKAYEGVEFNKLEEFVKDATRKLVAEMRK